MSGDSAIQALAGALGGVVAMGCTYPLIFLSTRSAVEVKKVSKSTAAVVLDIIKREGVVGLYSGLTSSLLGIAVTNGVYYFFYERTRGIILRSRSGSKGMSTLESILAGLIAGSATTLLSNPLWVIQTAQTIQTMDKSEDGSVAKDPNVVVKKLGFVETINKILSEGGWKALWRGVGPALVLVINPIIQYTVFEQLKNLLIVRRATKMKAAGLVEVAAALTDWDFFFLGALSKLVATSLTYPYIVVKSRLQAGHIKYKSAMDGLLSIIQLEGIEGLYKGVSSKLLQSVLTAAILFAGQRRIYEITKNALNAI